MHVALVAKVRLSPSGGEVRPPSLGTHTPIRSSDRGQNSVTKMHNLEALEKFPWRKNIAHMAYVHKQVYVRGTLGPLKL